MSGLDSAPVGTKAAKLDQVDAWMSANLYATSGAFDPAARCAADHFRLGIWLTVEQYPIKERSTSLKLAAVRNDKYDTAEGFNTALPDAFGQAPVAASLPTPPSLKKVYPIGASLTTVARFEAGLTSQFILSPSGDGKSFGVGYGSIQAFNAYLGSALALHVLRTRTFHTNDTGDFEWSKISRVEAAAATEKFGLKIYPYLKFQLRDIYLSGQVWSGIYPVEAGSLSPSSITAGEYNIRKRVERNNFRSGECLKMPLIPGVCQIHILIASGGGTFQTKEVYCDGDCIFP